MDPVVDITPRAAEQLARGSLWIFSNEVPRMPAELPRGVWCRFESKGRLVGTGYFNSHSLIAGRLLSRANHSTVDKILEEKIEAAFRRRLGLETDGAARLIFSEGDLIPGLVMDSYADMLVLQSNTAGIDNLLPVLEKIVPAIFQKVFGRPPRGFILRGDSKIRGLEGVPEFRRVVLGNESDFLDVLFQEGGVGYHANLLHGQKTGFFLDQRDNRSFLADEVRKFYSERNQGPKGLDLFSYSGGWGLRALLAGAAHVTFVDQSQEALDLIKKGFATNMISQDRGSFFKSDVFDFLEKDTASYDFILADPPAMVPSRKLLGKGSRAYEKLNRLTFRRLKPNGLLVSSSCSYHLSEDDFVNMLKQAFAKENGQVQIFYRGGQPADHPVLLSMPETRYLKCLGLRKLQ